MVSVHASLYVSVCVYVGFPCHWVFSIDASLCWHGAGNLSTALENQYQCFWLATADLVQIIWTHIYTFITCKGSSLNYSSVLLSVILFFFFFFLFASYKMCGEKNNDKYMNNFVWLSGKIYFFFTHVVISTL